MSIRHDYDKIFFLLSGFFFLQTRKKISNKEINQPTEQFYFIHSPIIILIYDI